MNDMTDDFEEPLLPHYVYMLLDPLNGNEPFYVGKGMGTRVSHHVDEVMAELRKTGGDGGLETGSAKQQRIADMIRLNAKPLEVILARFETAEEAFAVEAVYIHQVFGYDNLTNIAGGHGSKFIRTRDQIAHIRQYATDQPSIPRVDGIDQNRVRGVRDGAFRNEKIQGLTEAGAYDCLSDLQQALSVGGIRWRDYTLPGDGAFHPGESNGYLSVIAEIGGLDLNIQFTKTLSLSVNVIFTERTLAAMTQLDKLAQALGDDYAIGDRKKGGSYAWFRGDPRFPVKADGIAQMVALAQQFQRAIESTRANQAAE
jgi:hypothetical protein